MRGFVVSRGGCVVVAGVNRGPEGRGIWLFKFMNYAKAARFLQLFP